MKRILTLLALAALAFAVVACNGGQDETSAGEASTPNAADEGGSSDAATGEASVSIFVPAQGAVLNAGNPVQVKFGAEGVKIAPPDSGTDGSAHYAVLVDGEVTAGEPVPEKPGVIHTGQTSATLTDLSKGRHTITVVLVDGNHVPLDPPVQKSVVITVQ